MNLIQELHQRKLISPPHFLPENVCLLAIGGSESYGLSVSGSDRDIIGCCFPPRHYIFPWENGTIPGFGTQPPRFDNWVQHHIMDKDKGVEYDFTIYSIIRMFELCRQANPNMLDFLFTPQECIIHLTNAGRHILANRNLFLSRDMIPRFEGFSFNHLRNMRSQKAIGKRKDLIDKFGYDTKDAANCIRCALSLEDVLSGLSYDVRRHKDILKSIRGGEWKYEQVFDWATKSEGRINQLKLTTQLPLHADEIALRKVLIECLELHYGDLRNVIVDTDRSRQMLREIYQILENGKHIL